MNLRFLKLFGAGRRPRRVAAIGCAAIALGGSLACPLEAALQPDEIAVIAVLRSKESEKIARYYVQARGVPESQICLIDTLAGQDLRRSDWDETVRPYIRRWIMEKKLESKIRCLVTVWDVPLKILKYSNSSAYVRDREDSLTAEREIRVGQMNLLIDEINALLPDGDAKAPSADENQVADIQQLSNRFEAAVQAMQKRLQAGEDREEVLAANVKLLPMIERGVGMSARVRGYSRYRPDSALKRAEVEKLLEGAKGFLAGLQEGRKALEELPESVERDQQILSLVQHSEGLMGTLAWIDLQLETLRKNETYSSFDSELSLVLWPNYPLYRWQRNLLHYSLDNSDVREHRPTLMVSRLEAPTLELTRKLVDTAIAVEKQGLKGKVYLDARGLGGDDRPAPRGSYVDYDRSLRNLATDLKQHTGLDVVLDNESELFQPGNCPDAALYCGWYSLGKYVDAFNWNSGSVGYHLASREARTLRQRKSQVWCKRMLEEGVCATLGPVYEPYLSAFPRPDEFFVTLLSGRYTLVETFYRTKPFNSWVMTLVGDPLYNPFKNAPQLDEKTLPPELKRLIGE